MGFRFRKSFRVAPGIRLNLGSKSASVRVGPKGFGVTASTTGKKRLGASIPGTGLSYSKSIPSNLLSAPTTQGQQGAPSSFGKGPLVLLFVAMGAGLTWCGASSHDNAATSTHYETSKHLTQQTATLLSTANVRLRVSPSADSPIELTIPKGSEVRSSKREGAWYYVSIGSHSGWIHGDFLAAPEAKSSGATAGSPPREVLKSDRQSISGRAAVIDGDTIEVAGTRIRFNGIDAPEGKQICRDAKGKNYRCGQAATKALDGWLAKSRPATCAFVEWDQYGRFVGDCERADGKSVAAWLVSAGHALDWPKYSGGAYAGHQAEAQAARRGIWQGEFQPPWEWRAAQQAPKPEAASPPVRLLSGSCDIKGNVSNKGERIYHVPGQRFYDETKITPSKGERMFCSEDEARAAGWRRAKR